MTLCASGNLLLHSGHLLLTHTCRSLTLRVSALTWTSLLSLIAGLYAVQASYCMSVICVLECVCSHKGFLTATSSVPGMSLYGQSNQYDTCFMASLLQNIPALSAPTGDTKQRAGSSCSSPPANFSLTLQLQLQLAPTKLSTCSVRISSLEAL